MAVSRTRVKVGKPKVGKPVAGSRGNNSSGGLGRVAQAAAKQKGDKLWVSIDDGDRAVLRVVDVDSDFKDVFVHRVPFERENGSVYHIDVPCLDQDEEGVPCPGCKDGIERRYKFYTNVIWRDYKDPDGGRAAKPKDVLAIYSGGITVAKALNKKHQRYGLQNRDIVVEREGVKKNTKYDVDWADDENTPLTPADKKLIEGKFDFKRYIEPPDYDDFYTPPGERDNNSDGDPDYEESTRRQSPFKGERKTNRSSSGSRTTARSKPSSGTDKPKAGLAALRASKKAPEGKSSTGKRTVVVRKPR
jgi:hypothetical protein